MRNFQNNREHHTAKNTAEKISLIIGGVLMFTALTGCTSGEKPEQSDTLAASAKISIGGSVEAVVPPSSEETAEKSTEEAVEETTEVISEETIEDTVNSAEDNEDNSQDLTENDKDNETILSEESNLPTYAQPSNYTVTEANEKWGMELGAKDSIFGIGGDVKFSDNQTEQLKQYIQSGYMGGMVSDPRIASRQGGTDNPRIAWWGNLKKDNYSILKGTEEACYSRVTVYSGIDLNDKETFDLLDHPDLEEYVDEVYDAIDLTHPFEGGESYFMISYTSRNYCGDTIDIDAMGIDIVRSGTMTRNGEVRTTGQGIDGVGIPGIDYTITCEDPDAIHLLTAEESKEYMVYDDRVNEGKGAIVSADKVKGFYDSEGNFVTSGYIATKPGIFECTVTSTSTGKSIKIYIENLPVHYDKLLWGCKTQREMDLVVQYFLNSQNHGKMGQEFAFVSNEAVEESGFGFYTLANAVGIDKQRVQNDDGSIVTETRDWIIDSMSDGRLISVEGNELKFKKTDEALDWLLHLPTFSVSEIKYFGGSGHPYDAYYGITTGYGDCETAAAYAQAKACMCGLTTRYMTNSTHAWVEILVPGDILETGEDAWMAVSNLGKGIARCTNGTERFVLEGYGK